MAEQVSRSLEERAARAISEAQALVAQRRALTLELKLTHQLRWNAAVQAVEQVRKREADAVAKYREWVALMRTP
jgi:hypothetical protein